MDEFLATVGVQAMRYAIRSGIALTSSYAIGQCSRLLQSVDDKKLYSELTRLQKLLDSKMKAFSILFSVISPAIDLIEFKSGRGNVFLESALPLAKSLHQQIIYLGRRVEAAATAEERKGSKTAGKPALGHDGLQKVIDDLKRLLNQIDREIPLLQLAISASGEGLSVSLPAGISPSRLLQASTLLMFGDTQHAQDPTRPIQIGPSFTLSIYMLFLGHASISPTSKERASKTGSVGSENPPSEPGKTSTKAYGLGEHDRKPLWQEAIHKARVRLCRSACSESQLDGGSTGEYAYHLEIIEDLDDGRAHEQIDSARPYDGIQSAGIQESIPIRQLSKIFYTDTGRILNIGDGTDGENSPVLLLKRDINAPPLRSTGYGFHTEMYDGVENKSDAECDDGEQADIDRQLLGESSCDKASPLESSRVDGSCATLFPRHLDPEWIALEVFEEDDDDDDESNDGLETEDGIESSDEDNRKGQTRQQRTPRTGTSLDSGLISQIRSLSIMPASGDSQVLPRKSEETQAFVSRSPFGAITTSLSLVEMLIRLAGLQEFQQASHLSIPDHILTFFLEETSTTGLTGEAMWRARSETKQRVGFDPYTDATR